MFIVEKFLDRMPSVSSVVFQDFSQHLKANAEVLSTIANELLL